MTHGTRTGYTLHDCRCAQCCAVEYAYQRAYRKSRFVSRKVSAQLTRDHIATLHSAGLGDNAIAECCGCGPTTVRKIRLGRQRAIYIRTEKRILAVTAEGIADGAWVDAAVTRNLLLELLEEGWTRRQLNMALGFQHRGRSLPMLYKKRVTARTQSRVERLYCRLMREGRNATPEERIA